MFGKERIPEIRFDGFTDEWRVCNLKDIADRVIRKNTNNEFCLPLTISAQEGLVDQITYFNNRVASRDTSNYYLIVNGEFAYNKSTSEGYPFGAVKRLDKYDKGVLSTLYIVFRIRDNTVNSDYLTVFFDTDRWYEDVAERADEGARNHGLLNISAEDFFDISLLIPKDFNEQVNVGTFFKQLDNFINLHQNKYTKLVNMKSSLLEKMFPHDGAKAPEMRFSKFKGDWELELLGDYITECIDMTSDLTKYPLFSLTIEDGVTEKTERYERDFLISKSGDLFKIVPPEYFVTNPMNLRFGAVGYNKEVNSISVSGYYDVFSIDNNKCSPFWNAYFKTKQMLKKYDDVATGSLLEKRRVHFSNLKNLKVIIPKELTERQAIGNMFLIIDNLISLQQRKIDQLKNIKQSFLDKMFVS